MNYLIFVNTPAHVHLYRNLVTRLEERGHDVLLLGRDYGCTVDLLAHYDLPHRVFGRQRPSFRSLVMNLPEQFVNAARLARSYDPDVVFGRGAYAAFAGAVTRTPVVLVLDSEPSQLGHVVSSRFATVVLSPDAFEGDLGDHHYTFRALKECAYLAPEVYTPDSSVRDDLGVGPEEAYAIVRFNAFDSLHDVGSAGATRRERHKSLERLAERVTVFVSDEADALDLSQLPVRRYDIHPARIHDALAEARLVLTDTGTLATEAALLGTPVVRFVEESEQEIGEFVELQEHGLLLQRSELSEAIEVAEELIEDRSTPERWDENRRRYLARTADLTQVLCDVAENFDDVAVRPGEFPQIQAL